MTTEVGTLLAELLLLDANASERFQAGFVELPIPP